MKTTLTALTVLMYLQPQAPAPQQYSSMDACEAALHGFIRSQPSGRVHKTYCSDSSNGEIYYAEKLKKQYEQHAPEAVSPPADDMHLIEKATPENAREI